MTARPWMPLYVADYLKKTTHLGALESGAYLHLIMDYWQNGKLPTEDRQLARIAKLTDREWKRLKPILQAFFYDGWKHKRISEELAHAADVSGKRAAAVAAREAARRKQTGTKSGSNDPSNDDTLHTPHSTEKKEDTTDAVPSSATSYAFESGVIRLSEEHFSKWQTAFSHLDLRAELTGLAEWANQQGDRWFFAVAGALAKRNRTVKASHDKPRRTPADQDWKEAVV